MKLSSIAQIMFITIAVIVLSLLYFFYPATSVSFHPKCIFHELTGLYCPGCGSQRATSALLHGNLMAALRFNILFVISIPFIVYSAFVYTWNAFSKKKLQQKIFHSRVFIWSCFVVVLAFGILRNLRVYPFNLLAP
jgi:hypothetical protein